MTGKKRKAVLPTNRKRPVATLKRHCTDPTCIRTITDLRTRVDALTRQVALYERESPSWAPMRGDRTP